MVDRIWEHLNRSHAVVRDRSETWTVDQPGGLRTITAAPEFKALGSAAIRAAVDELLGTGRWHPPSRWGRLLVTFPSAAAEWDLPRGGAWHNDFVPLRQDAGLRALQLFAILKDLPARFGAGAAVNRIGPRGQRLPAQEVEDLVQMSRRVQSRCLRQSSGHSRPHFAVGELCGLRKVSGAFDVRDGHRRRE
jgi:hypothetical protein